MDSYFPAIPSVVPSRCTSYPRATSTAPNLALRGVLVHSKEAEMHPVSSRHRSRQSVGHTNRWRLPQTLLSDCLGSTQAKRALLTIKSSRNEIFLRAGTAIPECSSGEHSSFSASGLEPKKRTLIEIRKRDVKNRFSSLNASIPSSVEFIQPIEILNRHSRCRTSHGPDVLLKCLGLTWKLHSSHIQESEAIQQLLKENKDTEMSKSCDAGSDKLRIKSIDESSAFTVSIELEIKDPVVTQKAFAIALGHLYHKKLEVNGNDLITVLAAAHALKFQRLIANCADGMFKSISARNVGSYYNAALQYAQVAVLAGCKRWLELNLIPQLSVQVHLGQLPLDLLEAVITSQRLFTYSEFYVMKTVICWVFLKLNPSVNLMPSYSTVLTYFTSLYKGKPLLDKDEGHMFRKLFASIRLQGITDTNNVQDIHTANILPLSWIINALSLHHQSLHRGGDMSLMTDFANGCIRKGFILDKEPHYHSEILSLLGFHFELKACRNDSSFLFYMERIKPGDPILTFSQMERHTFSLRDDRCVQYSIRVQFVDKQKQYQSRSTGILCQSLGIGKRKGRSEVLTLDQPNPPLFVTFSLLFPPS